MTTSDQPHPISDTKIREGEMSSKDTEEMKAERRRGRKRGKHNFEPGYKEMLFKEWEDFAKKHSRCPKSQEIQSFSEKSFRNRRKELEAEDPNHPLLVILEEPLDAIQVKNLFNNEKKKKKKQARTKNNGFSITSLQGLPLGEAALMMHGWLQNASAQNKKPSKQQEKKQSSHQPAAGKGKPQVQQESSGTSDVSCRASDKFHSPLSFPLTPKSTTPPQTRLTGGPFNFGSSFLLNLDHKSEDESESHHGHRSPEPSGVTSMAIASLMDATTDASSHPPKALDPSRIRQSTAGEVIGRLLYRQSQQGQQAESPHSGPLHFSDCSPMFSPRTPSLQPLSVPPHSITSGTAMDFIQAHSKASSQPQQQQQQLMPVAQSQTVSVNLADLQQLVKDAVDEQVRKQASSQKPPHQQPASWWHPESPQSSYAVASTGPQIQKLMELMQEYKHQQGVLQG